MSIKLRELFFLWFFYSCCIIGIKMYIYGGCFLLNKVFNDLYCFDLREGWWKKFCSLGFFFFLKECVIVVVYDNRDIVIFGGWC